MPTANSTDTTTDDSCSTSWVVRRRLLSRFFTFILLEFGFIALSVTSLAYPLTWSTSTSRTLTKGLFTLVVIVWQTIAITCAQEVVLHGFSSEWYYLYRKSGFLIPDRTDVVSTITSSFWKRFLHSTGVSASLAYRISFVTFWILFALSGIAPASINVDVVQHFTPTTLSITNFTITGSDGAGFSELVTRAGRVVELERQENTLFRLTTEEHVIVGWPKSDVEQLVGDLEYASDAVMYNMSCQWEAPTVNTTKWNTTWYAGGFSWYPWIFPDPEESLDGGIMPMFRFSLGQEYHPHTFPTPIENASPIGLSGYLFLGRNSSFSDVKLQKRSFNLDNLPTTLLNRSGFDLFDVNGAHSRYNSPLASFLLCDPNYSLADGRVLVTHANTSLRLISTTPITTSPKVGNISPGAANVILGSGLMDVLSNYGETTRIYIGPPSAQTFTNDTSLEFRTIKSNPFDVGILSTKEIQHNLNALMQSGSKFFSSFTPTGNGSSTVPIQGSLKTDAQVLSGSRAFVITTVSLFLVAALAMIFNLFYLRIWTKPVFKIRSLIQVLQSAKSSESPKRLSSLLFTSHSKIMPGTSRPCLRSLLARLFCFIALEVSFLSLVLVCTRTPIVIKIPFSSTEVKGGFTLLSIFWQGIAIFILSDPISFAFSSEWSLQRKRSQCLIPGESDRVSRLTSANDDRIRYLFTRKPTLTFYSALLATSLTTALSSFAPGSFSIGPIQTMVDTSLKIADFHRVFSTIAGESNDNNIQFIQERANGFIRLEQLSGNVLGYTMEPNWLAAFPDKTSINSTITGRIEYPTDVIRFSYSCEWQIPDMLPFDDNFAITRWMVDGQWWGLESFPVPDVLYVGGILPLYRRLNVDQPDNKMAFVVLGTNDSLPVESDVKRRSIISLNRLPTAFHPSGLNLTNFEGMNSTWTSPLSSILLCDPQAETSGGIAQVSPGNNLRVVASGMEPIGNIPDHAIAEFFTSTLTYCLDSGDILSPTWVEEPSARVFLQDPSMNFTKYPRGIPLQNLDTLTANLDQFTLTSSKAFLDGLYSNPGNASNLTLETRSVMGRGEIQQQALLGDKVLGIITVCLSGVSVVVFGVLMRLILKEDGQAFDLANLLPALS